MSLPLFSTYRQGENRVTATLLAVLQRLSLPNIELILGALVGDTGFSLVTFQNQVKGDGSVPDAEIKPGRSVVIETKTTKNAIQDGQQIQTHLQSAATDGFLVVLTPDDNQPSVVYELAQHDKRIVWSSFDTLDGAIDAILNNSEEPPFETEAFLLRELHALLEQEHLLSLPPIVAVIAGGIWGWPMYRGLGVYRCTVGRRMRPLVPGKDRVAFYADGQIKPLVPIVKSVIEEINLEDPDWARIKKQQGLEDGDLDFAKQCVAELQKQIKAAPTQWASDFIGPFKLVFLSAPEDPETKPLDKAIKNDKKSESGRTVAFTQGTRYVTLESLQEVGSESNPLTSTVEHLNS